jgi:hypothetical protein
MPRKELMDRRNAVARALAYVRFKRGELNEASALCDQVLELTAGKETRASKLWLGPLHVQILVAAGQLEAAGDCLRVYDALVRECQSPYFVGEVARLKSLVSASH